ncbi:MAG: hypothetical protein KBC64_02180 [Simkaniaceae bacterium]|nr:hypothetical protein [Simkaniaceae bacterium]
MTTISISTDWKGTHTVTENGRILKDNDFRNEIFHPIYDELGQNGQYVPFSAWNTLSPLYDRVIALDDAFVAADKQMNVVQKILRAIINFFGNTLVRSEVRDHARQGRIYLPLKGFQNIASLDQTKRTQFFAQVYQIVSTALRQRGQSIPQAMHTDGAWAEHHWKELDCNLFLHYNTALANSIR